MMNNPYKAGTIGNMSPFGFPSYAPGAPLQPQTGVSLPPVGPSGSFIPGATGVSPATVTGVNVPGQLPMEQSFIENILRLNVGKVGTFYMTYENNREWNAKVFRGRIEAAGRDHIIISDPATGMRFLLLMVNLDYVTFDEELNYTYPFGGGGGISPGR
ncbi:spore coat protein GerQ [Paenibacillus hamazuiensis]|uniref:spore coat protein GerQ n=1 Tax=Paenibacillus hamazuiensis TaxID=2936508 RepID=UPI00200F7C44|nr:spore coat protein GerQ [Paenibacillus hamazuiensis]